MFKALFLKKLLTSHPKTVDWDTHNPGIIISATVPYEKVLRYLSHCNIDKLGMIGIRVTEAGYYDMVDLVEKCKDKYCCLFKLVTLDDHSVYDCIFITLGYLANPYSVEVDPVDIGADGTIEDNNIICPNIYYKWKSGALFNLSFYGIPAGLGNVYKHLYDLITPAVQKALHRYSSDVADSAYTQYRTRAYTKSEQLLDNI